MSIQNIFQHIPEQLSDEVFETLATSQNVRIERILSKGHQSPPAEWYDQEWDEWVLLLSGQAKLEFENSASFHVLAPGDYLFIPAHHRHRVSFTDPDQTTLWLAIHIH